MSWNKIIECVPNFSEGRDLEKIDQIVAPFRSNCLITVMMKIITVWLSHLWESRKHCVKQ